ncbi:MAG: phospho-N-acetylmuramoyl-pentapeptide-transferase [Clostridia bacterium]|nr:phospho-N-acetylmuramoyl-pentapeptide-transferase [Clostridia bacterium]
MLVYGIFCFLFCFVVAFLISPLILYASKKLKAGQNILHYVDAHKSKQGTPTMCGLIFIFGTFAGSIFAFNQSYTLALMTVVVMLAFGVLGFLDDFIKIKSGENEGLKPYQKIIGQLGISLIISFFVYNFVGTSIYIPFSHTTVDIGFFIIPLVIITFIAFVNSVNLIDGLDGLCGGVSFAYLLSFVAIMTLGLPALTGNWLVENQNLVYISACMLGAILAFLIYNGFPAKVFMGDTGSLALGGFLSAIAVFSGLELYILILGIPYVITSLSDIIQVFYYKRTKKRIFLMAPLHHHFEKKGFHENKVVIVYIIITLLIGLSTYALTSVFGS